MEYTLEIVVNVPRERFIELFDDPENMSKWQKGLVSFTPLTGVPGQPGATSKLVYKRGKKTMDMIETITARDLPERFNGTYDVSGVHNVCNNEFFEYGEGKTLWRQYNRFDLKGAMKLVGLVAGGSFRKETYSMMEDFKRFAEENSNA